MKKINILKNSRDFDRIIRNNKPYKYKEYMTESAPAVCWSVGASYQQVNFIE